MSDTDRERTVTLKDIAARAGCSVNTASLAMRNSERLSGATRRKVRVIARQLGYVPDISARNLARNRSGLIGVYARALRDAVRTELVNALIGGLHTADYRPILGLGPDREKGWRESPWIRSFQEWRIEAFVIVSESDYPETPWLRRIPTILVGCQPRPDMRCDYLGLDRAEGGRTGIEHLLARGHRRILVCCPPASDFARGCVESLKRHRLRPCFVSTKDDRDETLLRKTLRAATRARNRPSAVLFGDSPLAARFIGLACEQGIAIPSELAVASYDYLPWANHIQVPLTTIEQPIAAMADAAVGMVKARLADLGHAPMRIVLPHKLAIRQSS